MNPGVDRGEIAPARLAEKEPALPPRLDQHQAAVGIARAIPADEPNRKKIRTGGFLLDAIVPQEDNALVECTDQQVKVTIVVIICAGQPAADVFPAEDGARPRSRRKRTVPVIQQELRRLAVPDP